MNPPVLSSVIGEITRGSQLSLSEASDAARAKNVKTPDFQGNQGAFTSSRT
jgi:hypothetical protein